MEPPTHGAAAAPDAAVSTGPSPAAGAPSGPSVVSFEDFYRQEFPHLLLLARALVGSGHDEDVVQETFVAAYRNWRKIAGMESPVGYVRRICLYKAISVTRRRSVERRALRRLQPLAADLHADPMPEDSRQFWERTRALPRRQAQAVALYYALDLSVAEVAEILNCSKGTVKVHLHRARHVLATQLGTEETAQ